jgi:NAD(P)-dependent dehydrogenase (short-subunit alcohol dehydrogenase family)
MSDRKTAIVTGASSGLGRAIAEAFARDGYNLVLSGRNVDRLSEASAAIGKPDRVVAEAGDVAIAADRKALVETALGRFGRIDALVNNAGIFEPRPFLEVDEEHLDRFLNVNLKGTYFLSQAVIPHMQAAGGGAIVNIGTVLVDHAITGVPVSAPIVSKGAIHALTGQLAAEFGPDNIRVSAIAPGIVRTPIHARNGVEDADSMAGLHLLGRIGEPDEIAEAALMLANNSFISGAILNVDGGHVAGHAIH